MRHRHPTATLPLLALCALVLTAPSCDRVDLENAPCPCADGFVCCPETNLCVAESSTCDSLRETAPDAAAPTPDGRVAQADAAPEDQPTPDASLADAGGGRAAHTIFLNFEGAQLAPGAADDSATNTSSIVSGPTNYPPFDTRNGDRGDAMTDITQRVREAYAAYDVAIVTTRPTAGDYIMVLVGGDPSDVGFPGGAGGATPFTCESLPRSIAFVFSEIFLGDNEAVAYAAARQSARGHGLETVTECSDIMGVINCGPKSFLDFDSSCSGGACRCGGVEQNSHQRLRSVLGDAP